MCTLPERMQFMRFSQCDHDWPRSRGANSFGGAGQLLNPEAAGKPANPAMERCRDRHCRRGAAALLFGLRRPGAYRPRVSSRPKTPARPHSTAGFFLTLARPLDPTRKRAPSHLAGLNREQGGLAVLGALTVSQPLRIDTPTSVRCET